jgi:hypothetical protein
MQDLGGCRAVLDSVGEVERLVSLYEQRPCKTAVFCEKYDHVLRPKSDGYRGIHLVYKYSASRADRSVYNGLRIEVQIRSVFQHAWATALETIDTFTWQRLKSGFGRPEWRRFFVLASCFLAMIEERPLVEGVEPGWTSEFEDSIKTLNVQNTLLGITAGMRTIAAKGESPFYILVLDSVNRTTEVFGFASDEAAAKRYLEIERVIIYEPNVYAVQVSMDSLKALHQAYPNYYLDTERFVAILNGFLSGVEQAKQNLAQQLALRNERESR